MTISARISILILSVLFLSHPGVLYAQTEIYPTRKVMMEERKGNRIEKIRNSAIRMQARFDTRLENYEAFLKRVHSRRDKLADKGVSMTKIDAYLVTAEKNLTSARTTQAAAKVKLETLNYTGEKGEIRAAVMSEIRKVKQSMTTLHTSMSQTVKVLKESDALKPLKKTSDVKE